MDPHEFGHSTLPLQHEPYDLISTSTLAGTNAGKVAVITGAARGIGAAIAQSLAKSGANVALLDISIEDLSATNEACKEHGVNVSVYACDVTESENLAKVFEEVKKDIGKIE